jgi:hypothetical protein
MVWMSGYRRPSSGSVVVSLASATPLAVRLLVVVAVVVVVVVAIVRMDKRKN